MKRIGTALLTLSALLSLLAPAATEATHLPWHLGPTYDGAGIIGGAALAGGIVNNASFRLVIIRYVSIVLTYMALAATVVIIAGGIMLIFGLGDDAMRDKVKKMVIFVAIGFVIIMLSQGLVAIFVQIAQP